MGKLAITNLSISFGEKTVIDKLSLTINESEIVSILGPSGVGKTTILKVVAGLLTPQQGEIYLNDKRITSTPPEKRAVVLMFQQPLLFPHMTVEQNIAFGLRVRGRISETENRRIHKFLKRVQLVGYDQYKPHQLSGGQQQRVALARALITEPSILLLDEPLSSLDSSLRREMRDLIKSLQYKMGTTMLFVTHDQSEAITLSHRIALLLDGNIRQYGTPSELIYRPVDFQVSDFFGNTNRITGTVKNGILDTPVGHFELPPALHSKRVVTATIRPEHIRLASDSSGVPAKIENVQFEGNLTRVKLTCNSIPLTMQTHKFGLEPGHKVQLDIPEEYIWFPPLWKRK